ncbi:MAG: pyridoxal-phosphate dependent enzyme, partial [Acidimicrobiia bacterium]|nr:pyridoxal-phosphate dependent enzyme [Acidimicrobiia bacterium]
AAGIRVPAAIGDFLILEALRESGGFAIAVTDEEIAGAQERIPRSEGLLLSPEGAATYAAYRRSLREGRIDRDDRVMLFNCGNGLKYAMPPADQALNRHQPIDWAEMRSVG